MDCGELWMVWVSVGDDSQQKCLPYDDDNHESGKDNKMSSFYFSSVVTIEELFVDRFVCRACGYIFFSE